MNKINEGFIKIDNSMAEVLARLNLSKYENRLLWVIIRKTLGWNKTKDAISITQFMKASGIPDKGNVHRTLSKLAEKQIIEISKEARINVYQIKLPYDDWLSVVSTDKVVPKDNVVPTNNKELSVETRKQSSEGTTTKERPKNTHIQKPTINNKLQTNPSLQKPKKLTPIQRLVAYYKKLYVKKYGSEPMIGEGSWGKWGRLLKSKLDNGYTLREIADLLLIFSKSPDSHPNKLGFDLGVFLSDFVFNKMLQLGAKKIHSSSELEKKYGKWK